MKNLFTRSEQLDPLNDFLFYKVMGEKEDDVQLLGFINAVLGKTEDDKFTSIEILENKTFTPENIGDKSVTLDVRAVLHGKTKVNVEVQLRNEYNMDKRSLFQWSREFSRSLKAGQDYSELPNVIAINIVNFDYLGTEDFHSCFHLRDAKERDIILTGALEIHFINMVRFRKENKKLSDSLTRWLIWLDKRSPPELLEEVSIMDPAIQAANNKLDFISDNEDAMDMYRRRFMAMCDYTSGMNHARSTGLKRGLKKGRRKGVKEGRHEIIELLKSGKSPDEIIRDYSG